MHVRSLDNLINTGYGRAVLAKMLLLLALVALGAYNRQRAVPRLKALAKDGGCSRRRRDRPPELAARRGRAARHRDRRHVGARQLRARQHALPRSVRDHEALGPLELQMTVDPARTGSNAMHFYLINAKDGTSSRAARSSPCSSACRTSTSGR